MRDSQTDDSANDREHQALHQKLTGNARAASAQRHANGEFVAARISAHEEEIATFAHAISRTIPIVPITTQSVAPTSPTMSCFSGRSDGSKRDALGPVSLNHIGIMRATSAFACSSVTPGLSLATP